MTKIPPFDYNLFGPLPDRINRFELIKHRIPAEFDDNCKHCRKPMEFMTVRYCTARKPFATYQCKHCKARLLIFEAPITPLLVWSNDFTGAISFSEFIDELIVEREHKRKIRALREQDAAHS